MVKYKRLTIKIIKWLSEKGEASTHQIYDFANTGHQGIVMTGLTNLLSKNKNFEKVGVEAYNNSLGGREVCIWRVKDSKDGHND